MWFSLLVACATPDLRPVEDALGAAAPLAFAAAQVVTAWENHAAGAEPPCGADVEVVSGEAGEAMTLSGPVGPDCPIPAVGGASGTLSLAAASPDDGDTWTLTADFSAVSGSRLSGPALLTSTADADGVTVIWAGGDVGLEDDGVTLGESALVTTLDRGDVADPTDDRATVEGAVQVAVAGDGAASTRQVVFTGVVLDAACGESPVAGDVLVQASDAGDSASLDELKLAFHPACDGKVDVQLSAGASAASTGSSLPITLGDDRTR